MSLKVDYYKEKHRPQFHFSPEEKWMNDPNGMVYHNGEYHLFYQYHPESMVWGPMHWGHAVSKNLVHWQHLPIALYPDSLGLIFSGSAVTDIQNTSALGSLENPPMVAIFTYHSMEREKAGEIDYQTQGIAYSLDNGRSWTKYPDNPVLKNPGVRDFRDPKVFRHEESNKWIMILAVGDHVELYGSADLKTWDKLSEFGHDYGSHGGVWECPDLFKLKVEEEQREKWVMLVSINPGGPHGGSATQYFVGDFDGKTFRCDTDKAKTMWIDKGQDNYAGVTWSNAPGNRKIFLGWMSNWNYAQEVPTSPWRSAMTLPRDLSLANIGGTVYLKSSLAEEVNALIDGEKEFSKLVVNDSINISRQLDFPVTTSVMRGIVEAKDFFITVSNNINQKVKIGFDAEKKLFYVDKSGSGNTEFSKEFRLIQDVPRYAKESTITFTIALDVSSVEVFFDDGVSVMTTIFFPDEEFTNLTIHAGGDALEVESLEVKHVASIW